MRNYFLTSVPLRRIDICDLMLACLAAEDAANDSGEKWKRLHKILEVQLQALDAQLNDVVENESK